MPGLKRLFPLVALLLPLAAHAAAGAAKVPVTTSNETARAVFLEGRAMADQLRATDAHAKFEKAVALDPSFASAWLAAAQTAPSAKDFFAALEKASALAGKVSEGERLLIQAARAGATSDPAGQQKLLSQAATLFPGDERVASALGLFHFGRQEWAEAIRFLQQAIELEPAYTVPYNQLGYAYRFQGRFAEAEQVFKKYIELLPRDPNPWDSYAELLMKVGRFEESIAAYGKALELDPHFVASYVGIGHNQVLQGKGDAARATFDKLLKSVARNSGEKRTALFWLAMTNVHEGRYEQALAEARREEDVAKEKKDLLARSQDLAFMGNILLQAGKADAAEKAFKESLAVSAQAKVPDEVKEAAKRNGLFNLARAALQRGDLKAADEGAAGYRAAVSARKIPFEVWQSHELDGMLLLAKKDFGGALASLDKANPQNPRVTYLMSVAWRGQGELKKAAELARKTADYNEITNPNYAYVRADAKKLAESASGGG